MYIIIVKTSLIIFLNIRPDSENSFKGSKHTKGVAEDPKGLKPTDCDCWVGGDDSASLPDRRFNYFNGGQRRTSPSRNYL